MYGNKYSLYIALHASLPLSLSFYLQEKKKKETNSWTLLLPGCLNFHRKRQPSSLPNVHGDCKRTHTHYSSLVRTQNQRIQPSFPTRIYHSHLSCPKRKQPPQLLPSHTENHPRNALYNLPELANLEKIPTFLTERKQSLKTSKPTLMPFLSWLNHSRSDCPCDLRSSHPHDDTHP